MPSGQPFLILHGEDEETDVRVVKTALDKLDHHIDYLNLPKGDEIINRAQQTGDYTDPALRQPDLVLLDIGLPGIDGLKALELLRNSDKTKSIPVLMFSGSSSIRDFERSIASGANGYIQKTTDLDFMIDICGTTIGAWIKMSRQEFI